MVLDETATPLVLVRPDDGAESVLERARAAGAARVQLLVPDEVVALRRPGEVARLAALAEQAGIGLLLITSDAETLAAARLAGVATVAVSGARVAAPPPAAPGEARSAAPVAAAPPPAAPGEARSAAPVAAARPESPYSTRVLDQDPTPTSDAAKRFLAGLDDLDAPAPAGPGLAREEEAAAAASIAAALREPPPTMTDEELLAATLAADPGLTPPRVARPAPAPAPAPAPGLREARSFPEARAAPRREPRRPVAAPPAARRTWPIIALTLALLALLGAIGAVLLWGSRVEVTVTPPPRPETVEPISALPVPLAAPGSGAATAVEAEPVRSEVAFSVEGEVTEGTMTPAGSASGTVTIFNSNQGAVPLPAGTEFIAVKPDGQEVPFVSTADAQVPGATTSDTGAQIIISRGQTSVPVTARSPGSGSNVDGNSIRRVVTPGGAPFTVDTGSFIVQHPPLTGGSEEEVRIVKDSNVQALLAPALEGLDAEARAQLAGLAQARGLSLDPTTIVPRRAELEQLQGFDYTVQPAVGQTLDPNNPRFTLTVQASYNGLGVPADRPLDRQLGPVLTEQLLQAGRIVAGDCRAPAVTGWAWDGERLLVDGQIAPDTVSPGCQGGLDQAALDQVREAVRGKSREEAAAALDALVARGLIGGYTLPDAERLPGWDWQLKVRG